MIALEMSRGSQVPLPPPEDAVQRGQCQVGLFLDGAVGLSFLVLGLGRPQLAAGLS